MTIPSIPDVLIVGGGIIGLLTARELALAGLEVTVLERAEIGRESSWAGGGILSPLRPWAASEAVNALCRWSQQAYPDLAGELFANTEVDPEWVRSGLVFAACAELELALPWCEEQGVTCRVLTPAETAEREPMLARVDAHSLWLPEIAQIRNPRLIRALRLDLDKLGVNLMEHQTVRVLERDPAGIRRILTREEAMTAGVYVIAAGAWSGVIARNVASTLNVAPVKGQMLVFRAEPGLLNSIVLKDGRYLIPRRDGRILVGSTVEHTDYEKDVTEQARAQLAEFAYGIVPELRKWPIEKHWAGLRPGSPEGIPRIARHPEISNLYFNCGHYRNGFVMAPASARLLADLILARPPVVSPAPYGIPDLPDESSAATAI
jgi:glycine oxidase